MILASLLLTLLAAVALPVGVFVGPVWLVWVALAAALGALAFAALEVRRRGPGGPPAT